VTLDGLLVLVGEDDPAVQEIDPALISVLRELLALERQEREISGLRRRLHERLASFANPSSQARERELSDQRRALHARIDELRAQAFALLADAD
jgi:hypothetical protein